METELKTAAAYIRVSTDNQTELSPDSQIKTIKKFAKQNGYIVPNEFIFRDDGISGRTAEKRPEFKNMIAAAKQKPAPFSVVLLWKFSRFARNQEESIFYKSMLRKNGIEVISVSEPIVDGPFGTLIERIIEWSDEYYSIRLSGEVKRGMTEKVSRGGVVSVAPFGYKIEDKKLIINPDTAQIVKSIFDDYLHGIGSIQIARKLNALKIKTTRGNVWENRTVDYILQNPVYIGKIRWNPKRKTRRNYLDPDLMIVDGQHEAIIDENVFNDVQQIFEKNKKKHVKYSHTDIKQDYMLHGLIKCSSCGASLSLSAKGKSLQCIKYTHGKCDTSHSITLSKLNEMVLIAIEQAFKTKSFNLKLKETSKNNTAEIDINSLIEKEELKYKRIKEAYEDGIYTVDELRESKLMITQQIEKLRQNCQLQKKDKTSLRSELVEKNKNVLSQLRSPNLSEAEKHDILCSFIDKIVFDRARSEIELFFYA